jgi:hypothetical protein
MFKAPDAVGLDQLDDLGLNVHTSQRVTLWESGDGATGKEDDSAP